MARGESKHERPEFGPPEVFGGGGTSKGKEEVIYSLVK